jgi:SAM-dependent methyltransferase
MVMRLLRVHIMTSDDTKWVQRMLVEKQLDGPVLELGVGYGGETCRELIEAAGLRYFGTDVEKTPAVDFVADFERSEDMNVFSSAAPFGAALVLNVLEHTFDPIRTLDNVISLLKPGGKCAVLTPSIWPLHNYPMDAWRILPNLYEEYARRRGLTLDRRFFDYVGQGPIEQFRSADGNYSFPPPCGDKTRLLWSRVVHRLFNTFGRAIFHPSHVAVGALFQTPTA